MNQCIDPNIGQMLTMYKLAMLSDDERDVFELHLMDCDVCCEELKRYLPLGELIASHGREIRLALGAAGEMSGNGTEPAGWKTGRHRMVLALANSITGLLRIVTRRPLVWKFGSAILLLAMALLLPWKGIFHSGWQTLRPLDDKGFLTFVALPYSSEVYRDWPGDKGQGAFDHGMRFYDAGQYDSAAEYLAQSVYREPDEPVRWLYLGVSDYLARNPDAAIEALSKADCLSTGIYRLHARWYLAQSYILNRQTPKAVPLLQWVVSQKFGDHGEQAASLLANVSKGK